jgi:hypothetical protein
MPQASAFSSLSPCQLFKYIYIVVVLLSFWQRSSFLHTCIYCRYIAFTRLSRILFAMARLLAAAALVASALASPILDERSLEERTFNNCPAVQAIVTIMNAQKVATPFCSSLLNIPTITQTSTVTSTPSCVTVTTSVPTTDTITTVSTSVVYGKLSCQF